MSVVLDASIAIASLFQERHSAVAQRLMADIAISGALVPSLWRLEIVNVLQVAVRRGWCDEAFVDRSLVRFAAMPIEVDHETDLHAWGATLRLARECSLTLYDAAYLELPLRSGRPLVSCDNDLVAAATRKGIDVLSA